MSAADADAVARYLADPCPTTALVLVAGGGRLPAALTKAVKAAGGHEVKTTPAKTGDALAGALEGAGISLTAAAARRVADWFGDDAGRPGEGGGAGRGGGVGGKGKPLPGGPPPAPAPPAGGRGPAGRLRPPGQGRRRPGGRPRPPGGRRARGARPPPGQPVPPVRR